MRSIPDSPAEEAPLWPHNLHMKEEQMFFVPTKDFLYLLSISYETLMLLQKKIKNVGLNFRTNPFPLYSLFDQ